MTLQAGLTEVTPGVFEFDLSFIAGDVTLTATVDDASGRIHLEAAAASPAESITITRTHPSGRIVTVRSADRALLSSGILVIDDYEAPIGRTLIYTATAYDASDAETGASEPQSVLWVSDETWLKDPLLPGRNIRVNVSDPGDEQFDTPIGVNTVIGRPAPVVITDVRQAATGQLRVSTLTGADRDALHLLTSTGNVLLLQTDPDYGLGNVYMALSQAVSARYSGVGREPSRLWTLTYIETDAPIGDVVGGTITWQTVIDSYASWQELIDTEESWLSLFEGDHLGAGTNRETLSWRGA